MFLPAQKAESNSISNQKDFIRNFLADKKDIRIVKEYVDDGYSGSILTVRLFRR